MSAPPVSISANSTVAQAAEIMVGQHVGSVILVDESGDYAGIVTESHFMPSQSIYPFIRGMVSSLMGSVIGTEGNIEYDAAIDRMKSTVCSEVMDDTVPTVGPQAGIDEVVEAMSSSPGHHVPVVADGKPVGMVARHDLLKLFYRAS